MVTKKSPLSFHFFSMTKPISFSFLLSTTCSNPVLIILVDLHRTCSSTPLFLTMYSRCHLKNKHCWLYSCYSSLVCRSPPALHEHTATAGLYSKSLSISIFSCKSTFQTHISQFTLFLRVIPRCRILNLPVLNFKRFFSAHSLVLSLWIAVLLSRTPTTSHNSASPTNLREILSHHPRHYEILLNGINLRTSPLSMPLTFQLDFALLVIIPWIHQLSQLSIHHLVHLLSPYFINWVIRILQKLTKVLLKSWYETSVAVSFVTAPIISSWRATVLIWSDIYSLINSSLMFQITFLSLWLETSSKKVCSIILAEDEVRLIRLPFLKINEIFAFF